MLTSILRFAASNSFYKATCAVLFSRMLNTVARGVQLTEEVLPLPAKPNNFVLSRNLNGTLTASTSVRVLTRPCATVRLCAD
jgi:hypothetical protein